MTMNDYSKDVEVWKDVEGYEGYQVSNWGRVKSLPKYNLQYDRILKGRPNGKGYHRVDLYKNKKSRTFYVHILVASMFLSNCNNYLEINHIDGNKDNNCSSNLEYCTRAENIQHAYDTGLRVATPVLGEAHPGSKLTKEQVLEIRAIYARGGTSHRKLAKQFGVGKSLIGYIVKRTAWKHI